MQRDHDKEEIALLEKYSTNPGGRVNVVKDLPFIAGAAFARFSRATGDFDDIFVEEFLKAGVLKPEYAEELIDRVLNQYGDESVGEMESVHVAFQGVSNYATKFLEDLRIGGSPIEQSSRYVFYDQKDKDGRYKYYRDPNILASRHGRAFLLLMDRVFDVYCDLIEPMQNYLKTQKPLKEASYDITGSGQKVFLSDIEDEQDQKSFKRTYKFDLKTKACDIIRVLLPTCTLTNVGFSGNGRFFTAMLNKLYASDAAEFQSLGKELQSELNKIIPQYVKRAKRREYAVQTDRAMWKLVNQLLGKHAPMETEAGVELLEDKEEDFMDNILAEMLFSYARHPTTQLRTIITLLSAEEKEQLFKTYIGQRKDRRNRPGRALEFGYPLRYDIVGDFGIYRDLQRHRMLTQQRQRLSPYLGFNMPKEIAELDDFLGNDPKAITSYSGRLREILKDVEELYDKIVLELPEEAQYCTLFGHNIRWSMGMNWRELMHFAELRSIKQGHTSYRLIAQKMHTLAKERHPWLGAALHHVDHQVYYWARDDSEAKQRVGEKKLEQKYAKRSGN